MATEQLATYLNDHLAGSIVAIDLLKHLESAHANTPLQKFFVDLRTAIEADGKQLETLMSKLEIKQSSVRQFSAWISEKLTQLKLRFDDPGAGALLLLESLEVLSIGIEGKKLLWRNLATIAETESELRLLDYEQLIARAEQQRSDVEVVRLASAKKAFIASRAAQVHRTDTR
jgi:hypothetical protein